MRRGVLLVAACVLLMPGLKVCADWTAWDTSNVIDWAATDWSDNLTLNKFDPGLGTLSTVEIKLYGGVRGTGEAENLGESSTDTTLNLKAVLTLKRPGAGGTTIVEVIPVVSNTASLYPKDITNWAADDETPDYVKYEPSPYTTSETWSSSAADDLALFTGPGTIVLPITGAGQSFASGSGNFQSRFSTDAKGWAEYRYEYETTDIPEPGSMGLAALALLGLIGYRRRLARK